MPAATDAKARTRSAKAPERFGERLARLRQARSLTQEGLATAAGISKWMVLGYEARGSNPPVEVLPKLARALGVSVDVLVEETRWVPSQRGRFEREKGKPLVRRARVKRERRGAATEGFGARFARLRRERGLTQEDLGAALGVSKAAIAYYEGKDGHVQLDLLAQAAKVLGVSLDALFGNGGDEAADAARNVRLLRRLRQVEQLPEEEQRTILQLIEQRVKRKG
jgi:transcriptional regulator with XRE-family HTH domain